MQSLSSLRSFFISSLVFLFAGCSSNEIGFSADVNQQSIWQDYVIEYEEGKDNVDVFCQFRFAGENGTTLVLSKPAKIELDGKSIKVDSSDFTGAFYKADKPVAGFFGDHQLRYTDINGKKYENSFSLNTFRLENIPASIKRDQPLLIQYDIAVPLKADDYIEIVSDHTDSSFTVTHHYNEGDKIVIPQNELVRQKGNSLTIIATLYRKEALQQKTNEGGEIKIAYTLKPLSIKLN